MKLLKVLLFIFKCTFMAFGGGNALFPFIRQEAVKKNEWLTDKEFDNLIITTNMIPGPSVVESLSYVSMKVLGKWKGALITIIGIFPHIIFALGLYIVSQKFLPEKYLFVINVSIMPVIIGVLISFSWRFIKISNKEISSPLMIALILATTIFTLFVPTPWNIPAIIMIFVILTTLLYEYIKLHKKNKGDK